MKEKIVRYGLIIGSLVALIFSFAQAGDAPYTVIKYDFNSSLNGSYLRIAYQEFDAYPPSFTFGGINLSQANYSRIKKIDALSWYNDDIGNNFEPVIRFNFSINENPNNIDWIHILVWGNNDEPGGESVSCFIANFSSNSFSKLFDLKIGTSSRNHTFNLTDNPSDYIDTNSNLIVACAGENVDYWHAMNIDYIAVTVGNSTPAVTATLAVTLDEPANASSFELEFTNLIFNATTDIANGVIHNMTLYTNFSGTWKFNQTNQSVVSDNVKYSFDTALSHNVIGDYKWGVQSCSVSGICNWSVNYTLSINSTNDRITISLDEPADTSSYENSFTNLIFNATIDGISAEIFNATLYTNFSGTWKMNQSNQSVITDATKYSFDTALSHYVVGDYKWGVQGCTLNGVCNWSSNYTISVTAIDDILAVTLDEPADGSEFTNSFTDLNFNATCDITDGIIKNLTLYHNWSGTWKFNQTNQSTVTDNTKYTFDTALSNSNYGNFSWGVQCCSTLGVCNWSINYSLLINEIHTRTFEVIQWPTNPTTTFNGDEFIWKVNISCTGTDNCGAMSATLDPFKIDPFPSLEQTAMKIDQWTNCYPAVVDMYGAINNKTIKYPNGTIFHNITWGFVPYHFTKCDKLQIFNLSTINSKEKKVLDATNYGRCSYNSTCIVCDSRLSGNADGKCDSGESCYFNCGTQDKLVDMQKTDTVAVSKTLGDIVK